MTSIQILNSLLSLFFQKASNCLLFTPLSVPVIFFSGLFVWFGFLVVLKNGLCIMNYIWGLLVMYFHLPGDLVLQLIATVAERLSIGERSRCIVSRMLEGCGVML